MPITSSAKKALKQDRARKEINDLTRNKVKSAVKAARLAITASDTDAPTTKSNGVGIPTISVGAQTKLDAAYRELDVASKKNVIHKNRAARLKSRLTKKLTKVATTPAESKPVKKAVAKKKITKKK